MSLQTASSFLMIEPVAFGYNTETSVNNYFQHADHGTSKNAVQEKALAEFRTMVETLKQNNVHIVVIKDTLEPHTPDSIFPNNWISFHECGTAIIYPMFAPNRRLEKRKDILKRIEQEGFHIANIKDYSEYEATNRFLEGTGSMVLDRDNKTAFAALSERTDKALFLQFCQDFHYTPIFFHAFQTVQKQRAPIYHTNVMMSIGTDYAILCEEAIDDEKERNAVINQLKKTGKNIVSITESQMHHFAGNMLQIKNKEGKAFLVMSKTAHDSLSENQQQRLHAYNDFLIMDIPTIEYIGGGGVRCMMAEIF
ncbi:MAG: citrulline utilization hydrolase CtlX [Microbacter sp.]